MRVLKIVLGIAGLVTAATVAQAGDFDGIDYTLRFPAALSRISTYPDVAGFGGASAGSPWSSSVNPAASGWQEIKDNRHFVTSPIHINIKFDAGTEFHIEAASFLWKTESYGVFQPTFIQAKTNRAPDRSGLDYQFQAIGGSLQWAKRTGRRHAVGINLNVLNSDTDYHFGSNVVAGTDAETYGIRLGGLYQPDDDRWLLGIVAEYAYGPSRSTVYDIFMLGTGTVLSKDITEQILIRPGLSFEYMEDSRIYADYQFGYFENSAGLLRTHRIFAGVEQKIVRFVYLRGGMVADVRQDVAVTFGVGAYPTDYLSVDFGYQKDLFPELKLEFGSAEVFTGSVSLSF